MTDELAFMPALELAERARTRDVSSAELVDLYLERIERIDPELNTYVTVDADGARAAAREPHDGPFAGVPISIKDLTETAELRTTLSTRAPANNVPTFDTATVRLLYAGRSADVSSTATCFYGRRPATHVPCPRSRLAPTPTPRHTAGYRRLTQS